MVRTLPISLISNLPQILDSIRSVMKDEPNFGRANFCASSYVSDQNRTLECFEMTRDGFSMSGMSLTGRDGFSLEG